MIRDANEADAPLIASLIRSSFQDVALRFGLTHENCPTHPSNCADAWIVADLKRGVRYFLLTDGDVPCACAALTPLRDGAQEFQRLAVLPAHRRRGYGATMVRHALAEAARSGAARLTLGIIADHRELEAWYTGQGFSKVARFRPDRLPFEVAVLERALA